MLKKHMGKDISLTGTWEYFTTLTAGQAKAAERLWGKTEFKYLRIIWPEDSATGEQEDECVVERFEPAEHQPTEEKESRDPVATFFRRWVFET